MYPPEWRSGTVHVFLVVVIGGLGALAISSIVGPDSRVWLPDALRLLYLLCLVVIGYVDYIRPASRREGPGEPPVYPLRARIFAWAMTWLAGAMSAYMIWRLAAALR